MYRQIFANAGLLCGGGIGRRNPKAGGWIGDEREAHT